jgi:hypothetical protein
MDYATLGYTFLKNWLEGKSTLRLFGGIQTLLLSLQIFWFRSRVNAELIKLFIQDNVKFFSSKR